MHKIWTIATDDPVAWYVCQSVTRLRPAKTAKRIEVMIGVETPKGPKTLYSMRVNIPLQGRGRERGLGNIAHCTVGTDVPTNSHSLGGATCDAAIATLL